MTYQVFNDFDLCFLFILVWINLFIFVLSLQIHMSKYTYCTTDRELLRRRPTLKSVHWTQCLTNPSCSMSLIMKVYRTSVWSSWSLIGTGWQRMRSLADSKLDQEPQVNSCIIGMRLWIAHANKSQSGINSEISERRGISFCSFLNIITKRT